MESTLFVLCTLARLVRQQTSANSRAMYRWDIESSRLFSQAEMRLAIATPPILDDPYGLSFYDWG